MKRLPAKEQLDDSKHPSVILWSLFDEEGLHRQKEGMELARVMNVIGATGSGRPIDDVALTAQSTIGDRLVARNQARLRLPTP